MKNIFLTLGVMLAFASCSAQKQPVPNDMKTLFPNAEYVTIKGNVYTVNSASDAVLGYAVYSKPASDGIKGFKGETPLLVTFGTDKKVSKVVMLPNQDTPGFVERVKKAGLLDSWKGLSPKQALSQDVDVVSGATFTSNGVINTMKKTLENTKL